MSRPPELVEVVEEAHLTSFSGLSGEPVSRPGRPGFLARLAVAITQTLRSCGDCSASATSTPSAGYSTPGRIAVRVRRAVVALFWRRCSVSQGRRAWGSGSSRNAPQIGKRIAQVAQVLVVEDLVEPDLCAKLARRFANSRIARPNDFISTGRRRGRRR